MATALITGATQGFGKALAIELAKEGWQLIVDGRRTGPIEEIRAIADGLGAEMRALAGDITDPEHRVALMEAARSRGGIDLLVNNASELGPSPLPYLDELAVDDLRRIYDVNVFAPLALVQLAMPLLRRPGGAIVSVSSDAAVEAYPGWGGYGSSKAALDQLTAVLAVEHPDLAIYAFDPGDMRTAMHQLATPGEDISDLPEPENVVPALRRLLAASPPSGRYGVSEWGAS